MKRLCWLLAILSASTLLGAERIFRPERFNRGNVNYRVLQETDKAAWVMHPDFAGDVPRDAVRFFRFRRTFTANGLPFEIDVTADERYVLYLDGVRLSRGPDRGFAGNWTYKSYRLSPAQGEHRLEAVVWQIGDHAPWAQLSSGKGGFLLKASGAYDKLLTTGKAKWQVGLLAGQSFIGRGEWAYAAFGNPFVDEGVGFTQMQPAEWKDAVVVKKPLRETPCGIREPGWMLFPATLPDQVDRALRPGAFKAAGSHFATNHHWKARETADARVAELNALLREGRPFVVPPHTCVRAVWDLGDYYSAYPEICTRGGSAGAEIRLGWGEALYDAQGRKGVRSEFIGRDTRARPDRFRPRGAPALFTTPWWRCGRWCTLEVRAVDVPVVITSLALAETRYPLEDESVFVCDDDTLPAVRRLARRGMQMCCHEMFFDCPHYEQQMYPGDTRVELQVVRSLTRDERIIRRAMDVFDFARRPDGRIAMNFPTRAQQESDTYTMCEILMLGDYAAFGADRAWLAARRAGLRHSLAALQELEDAQGLVKGLHGWSFSDWVPAWRRGVAPDGESAERPNAFNNLFWVLAQRAGAAVERATGDADMAAYWERRAAKTAAAARAAFWDEKRGLVADDVAHARWSEHAQCLALLADALTGAEAARCFGQLIAAPDIEQCTVYFSYYLFETYFKFGRGDLFLKRLDLWRDYVKLDLKTPLESPDKAKHDGQQARSDCHAWGSHPLYFMQTGLAGVKPAAPFYAKVRVAPAPGALRQIRAKAPHPKGFTEVDLAFADGGVTGTVTLPAGVDGAFAWKGAEIPLKPGANAVRLPR